MPQGQARTRRDAAATNKSFCGGKRSATPLGEALGRTESGVAAALRYRPAKTHFGLLAGIKMFAKWFSQAKNGS